MAGVSVNSIDMDDFRGSFCDSGPYPFLQASLGLLMKNSKQYQSKTKNNSSTTTLATTPTEYYRLKTSSKPSIDENEYESTTTVQIKPLSRVISKKKIINPKTSSRINKKSELSIMNTDNEKNSDTKKVNAINKILNLKLPLQSVKKSKKPSLPTPPLDFATKLSITTNRNELKQNMQLQAQQSQSYFLITPPPQSQAQVLLSTRRMDPNEENYWKQELKKRQELKNQEQLRIQQEIYLKDLNKHVNTQSKPPVILVTPPSPHLSPANNPPIQQAQSQNRPIAQQNTLNYNQMLAQQQELEFSHKQQLQEYESQKKQNQQLELQQQQLKKLIQDQQWQLQQSKHQQAEQWVKGIQKQ